MREISSTERLYLACSDVLPPFCISLVIEVVGTIDEGQLKGAIQEASRLHNSSRWLLRKSFLKSVWAGEGPVPPLFISDSPFRNDDLHSRQLSEKQGPVCEVLVTKGAPNQIIFRCLHSVMDARGLLLWAQDVFKLLRNEQIKGSSNSESDQDALQKSPLRKERGHLSAHSPSPLPRSLTALACDQTSGPRGLGENSGGADSNGFCRSTQSLKGHYPAVVAQFCFALLKKVRLYTKEPMRIMVPVDLRAAFGRPATSVNFSNPLFLDLNNESTWQEIHQNILMQLRNKKQFDTSGWEKLLRFIPRPLLGLSIRHLQNKFAKANRWIVTGVVSHVGRISLSSFSTPDLTSVRAYFLPVDTPGAGSTFLILETDHSVEVSCSIPKSVLGDEDLPSFLSSLCHELKSAELCAP